MKKERILAIVLSLLGISVLLFPQCARMVALSGGARDTEPPHIVRSIPPNGATNFAGKRLKLTFNEYVSLVNAQKEIYFTPPLRWPYGSTIQGKSLIFDINDTLKSNVTYQIYLGKAIQDLTEKNPAESNPFSFSTGASRDSGIFAGSVRDALLHTPVEQVKVFLYHENSDSVVRRGFPDYMTMTDATGNFLFSNLPEGQFKLFALKDLNTNLRYDLPNESLAFSSSPITSYASGDTAERKSAPLNLFTYTQKPLALLFSLRRRPENIQILFSAPPLERAQLSVLGFPNTTYTLEASKRGDSLTYWFHDSSILFLDTLRLTLRYQKSDSLQKLIWTQDTLHLPYKFPDLGKDSLLSARDRLADSLIRIFTLDAQKEIPVYDSVILEVSTAIKDIDATKILILQDSTPIACQIKPSATHPRRWELYTKLQPRTQYKVKVLPAAFFDYFGRTNDETSFSFETLNPTQFATLHLALQNMPSNLVIEVLKENEKRSLVRSLVLSSGEENIDIAYLAPGNYILRFIDDRNTNGRWDEGNYWKQVQPESVRYFKDERGHTNITVRPNWEYDLRIDYLKLEE